MVNTSAGTVASIEVVGLRKSFGSTPVLRDVALTVPRGAVVALLGPSGCGKTTLLRTIAGLERADAGEIRVDSRVVAGPARHVPPERRQVGMVFQDWALFPHLSVSQNVGYGLPRADRKGPRVAEVLAMVGLDGLGDRQPATLSGGQQQRVALARALAPRPGVLLLDEPFSNLDATLRVQVRSEVHQLLTELGVTTVFVTHDQEEAFLLGDEVAVVHGGRIVQQAPPAALYARPATPWVASFVGDANLVAGTGAGDHAVTDLGAVPLETPTRGAVRVLLRPEELRLEPLPRGAPEPGRPAPTRQAATHQQSATPADGDQPPADHGPSAGPSGSAGMPVTVELREYYGHDTVYVVRPNAGVDRPGSDAVVGVDRPGADGADGTAQPDAGTWGDGAVPGIRVRAGSIPQFARGDHALLRYGGPPALAFPVDGSPSDAAPGNASEVPGAAREQPFGDAEAHHRVRGAEHGHPADGERTDGGVDAGGGAGAAGGEHAGGDERVAADRAASQVSERFARHAPTR